MRACWSALLLVLTVLKPCCDAAGLVGCHGQAPSCWTPALGRVAGYGVGRTSAARRGLQQQDTTVLPPAVAVGGVVAWGRNNKGQNRVDYRAVRNNVVGIAAGLEFALAHLIDGQLVGWGSNTYAQASVPPEARYNISAFCAGTLYAMAVLRDTGEVKAWGLNDFNQTSPLPDAAKSGVKAVACGTLASLAIAANGTLIGWGTNDKQQLAPLPPEVLAAGNVVAVSASDSEAMAVLADGSAVGWGMTLQSVVAASPDVRAGVVRVAAGRGFGLVLRADGRIFHFGSTQSGTHDIPERVQGNAIAICAGDHHAAAVTREGEAVTWGTNEYGEAGIYQPDVTRANVLEVGCGQHFTIALVKDLGRTVEATPASATTPRAMLSAGAIIGIAVACGAAVLVALVAVVWLYDRMQRHAIINAAKEGAALEGGKEEASTEAAREYCWMVRKDQSSMVALEAGVNDTALDSLLQGQPPGTPCPVIQLSRQEVKHQILLMTDGLLGTGATAAVFKCMWPTRFGSNALLAVKVLKDTREAEAHVYESFAYEISVLSSTNHPNVVRMYGYCIEPPTVCIILELLPCSLRQLLRDHSPLASSAREGTASSGPLQPREACLEMGVPRQAPALLNGIPPHGSAGTADSSGRDAASLEQRTTTSSETIDRIHVQLTSSKHTRNSGTGIGLVPLGSKDQVSILEEASDPASGGAPLAPITPQLLVIPTARGAAKGGHQPLSMAAVLRISTDVAAGLAYLHGTRLGVNTAATGDVPSTDKAVLERAASGDSVTGLNSLTAASGVAALNPLPAVVLGPAISGMRVVHRDLKPANVLINSQGVAKISDFGLARRHANTTVHTAHLGAGTLPYQAPELLIGIRMGPFAQAITNRVDVYSLGMMMWEMLAGQPPWSGMTAPGILQEVSKGRRPPLPGAPGVKPPGFRASIVAEQASEEAGGGANAAAREAPPFAPLSLQGGVLSGAVGVDAPIDATMAASLDALPDFNAVIRVCWHQRDLRRPTAAEVHTMLAALSSRVRASET